LAALLAVALLALVAAGCGGDDDSPSSDDVPPGAVAMVGDVEIEREELDKQVKTMTRAQRSAGGDFAKAQRDQLETQALSVILTRAALEQEAAKRGIQVSDAEVRKHWQTAAPKPSPSSRTTSNSACRNAPPAPTATPPPTAATPKTEQ
jgi:hypothetical protein